MKYVHGQETQLENYEFVPRKLFNDAINCYDRTAFNRAHNSLVCVLICFLATPCSLLEHRQMYLSFQNITNHRRVITS